jgi:hypothetical protein
MAMQTQGQGLQLQGQTFWINIGDMMGKKVSEEGSEDNSVQRGVKLSGQKPNHSNEHGNDNLESGSS